MLFLWYYEYLKCLWNVHDLFMIYFKCPWNFMIKSWHLKYMVHAWFQKKIYLCTILLSDENIDESEVIVTMRIWGYEVKVRMGISWGKRPQREPIYGRRPQREPRRSYFYSIMLGQGPVDRWECCWCPLPPSTVVLCRWIHRHVMSCQGSHN